MSQGVCENCGENLTIKERKHGSFYYDYVVLCSEPRCNFSKIYKYVGPKPKLTNKRTQIKKSRQVAAVYSVMCEGGMSHLALKKIKKHEFHKYKAYISEVAKLTCQQHLEENRRVVFTFCSKEGIMPDENGILKVDVIYDGKIVL